MSDEEEITDSQRQLMKDVYEVFRREYQAPDYNSEDDRIRIDGTDVFYDDRNSGRWVIVEMDAFIGEPELVVMYKTGGIAGTPDKRRKLDPDNSSVEDVMGVVRSFLRPSDSSDEVIEEKNPAEVKEQIEEEIEEAKENDEDVVLPSKTVGEIHKLKGKLDSEFGYVEVVKETESNISIHICRSPVKRGRPKRVDKHSGRWVVVEAEVSQYNSGISVLFKRNGIAGTSDKKTDFSLEADSNTLLEQVNRFL